MSGSKPRDLVPTTASYSVSLEFIKQRRQPFVGIQELLVAGFVPSRLSGIWLEGLLNAGELGSYLKVVEEPDAHPCDHGGAQAVGLVHQRPAPDRLAPDVGEDLKPDIATRPAADGVYDIYPISHLLEREQTNPQIHGNPLHDGPGHVSGTMVLGETYK